MLKKGILKKAISALLVVSMILGGGGIGNTMITCAADRVTETAQEEAGEEETSEDAAQEEITESVTMETVTTETVIAESSEEEETEESEMAQESETAESETDEAQESKTQEEETETGEFTEEETETEDETYEETTAVKTVINEDAEEFICVGDYELDSSLLMNYSQVSRHKKVKIFEGADQVCCSQYKASASLGVSIWSVLCGLLEL